MVSTDRGEERAAVLIICPQREGSRRKGLPGQLPRGVQKLPGGEGPGRAQHQPADGGEGRGVHLSQGRGQGGV